MLTPGKKVTVEGWVTGYDPPGAQMPVSVAEGSLPHALQCVSSYFAQEGHIEPVFIEVKAGYGDIHKILQK